MTGRPLALLPLPAGPQGLARLLPALRAAMRGSGPALALVAAPGSTPTGHQSAAISAVRADYPVEAGVALVLATSGSTGDPTGVELPAAALRAAATGLGQWCAQQSAPSAHRWVSLLPLHGIGGLMTVVRSLQSGAEPIPGRSLGGAEAFTAEVFAEVTAAALAIQRGDGMPLAVSLVPTMLTRLSSPSSVSDLRCYDLVLIGGAAAPAGQLAELRQAGVRVVTSYGMTETCGGCVFDGRPMPGVRVAASERGTLRITGPVVASGYRSEERSARFHGAWPNRTFHTADLGHVLPSGLVTVTGRADDVVQVGGTNVDLGTIGRVVSQVPGVTQAEAVALPDEAWGSRVMVFVTADPGTTTELVAQVRARVLDRLGRPARPGRIIVVDQLPVMPSGKVDREALRCLALEQESQ